MTAPTQDSAAVPLLGRRDTIPRGAMKTAQGLGRRRRSNGIFGWLMALPYVVLLLLFAIGPLAYAVFAAAQPSTSFIGGGNSFLAAVEDFRFLPAITNVATFLAIYLPILVIGVVALALALDIQSNRLGAAIRLVYILPGVITGSASVLLWYLMLQPDLSPFGPALKAMGLESSGDVFRDGNLPSLFAVMAFATGFGQWVVILFGSLQNIPEDVIEAAHIDGAGPWRLAINVKLPLIRKYIVYMLVLSFAGALQIFVEPLLLLQIAEVGGNTWSLNQLGLFFAFNNGDFASAAVVSLILLIVCLAGSVLIIWRGGLFQTEVDE
jgi:multiple sugar transport system permease protein